MWALLFVVGNASTHPEKCPQGPGGTESPRQGHMSKVYLPVLCWEAASHLMGWKGDRFKVGSGINMLTCLTGAVKVI